MLDIKNAILKDIDLKTQDLVRRWRNQDFIREIMFNQEIISEEEHNKWILSLKDNPKKHVKIFFFNEIPLGVVTFTKISDSIFEWGFYIGEKDAPRGMGSVLGISALDFYFAKLNSHKLCAEVLNYNEKSLAFHKKIGFTLEGILRKQYKQKNNFYDVHVFGLLKDEWANSRSILIERLKGENNEQ